MADETKRNPSEQQKAQGGEKPPAQKPPISPDPTAAEQKIAPGKAGDVTQGKAPVTVQPSPPGAAETARPAGAPPAGAHAAPPKPAGPATTPWEHERVARLKHQYGSGIKEAGTYLKQNFLVVNKEVVFDVLRALRDDDKFDYLVDETAVHYPDRDEAFEVVWILYSFASNERVRVKTSVKDGEKAPSAVPLWPAANWLEREVYDMFGVQFEGHPDLRRILLPDEWKGFPLRKDYGIIQQDKEWVQINLGIESGQ
ncbi:MAG TPA: NADH-quinone oxidoreductase subunit C [Terriglobales bacterium]|nr:NADH-quinone oxidoreductase subunit C [Terriglobales bacterium]